MYKEDSVFLVPVKLGTYANQIANMWKEAGTVTQGGMSTSTLTWVEIKAWADQFYSEDVIEWIEQPRLKWARKTDLLPVKVRRCSLSDYELLAIRKLSQEYSYELSCDDINRPCPLEIELEEVDALAESSALEAAMAAMFSKQ